MIPLKVKEHLDEYINQEVYVQIAIIKGKEKISTNSAIDKYFNSNHFKDLSEGKPYDHFIDGLRDKCLGKLKDSPMKNKQSTDKTILELQDKLNNLNDEDLDNTYWEIETGEFFSSDQIKELESNRNELIEKLDITKNKNEVFQTIIIFCKNYEKLCQQKYPEGTIAFGNIKIN